MNHKQTYYLAGVAVLMLLAISLAFARSYIYQDIVDTGKPRYIQITDDMWEEMSEEQAKEMLKHVLSSNRSAQKVIDNTLELNRNNVYLLSAMCLLIFVFAVRFWKIGYNK